MIENVYFKIAVPYVLSMLLCIRLQGEKSEYKRKQVAPGVKLTEKAFGKDRRMPITNTYKREKN